MSSFRRRSPRLMFNTTDATGSSTPPVVTPPAEVVPPVDHGFPANTATADMTDKELAAYWKFHSRRHEANAKPADYDDLRTAAAELAALKDAQKTADQKAIDEAHRQGESVGAEKYLLPAVEGRLAFLTGKPVADLKPALALLDLKKFLKADGELDEELVTTFAGTLGKPAETQTPPPVLDPIAVALAAIRTPGTGERTGGSIADMQKQIIEARSGSTSK